MSSESIPVSLQHSSWKRDLFDYRLPVVKEIEKAAAGFNYKYIHFYRGSAYRGGH